MEQVKITPSRLSGSVLIPPSKSLSHRYIFAASLSEGVGTVENIDLSQDIEATIQVMRQMGAKIEVEPSKMYEGRKRVVVDGGLGELSDPTMNCHESGSTLRFLIPFFTLFNDPVTFIGRGKLVSRPLNSYYDIFDEQGVKYDTTNGELPLTVSGTLSPGTFKMPGNVSSQFITGLMFVLPLLDGESTIEITSPLESVGYVDLTLDVLEKFGIEIENKGYQEYVIKGNQTYKQRDSVVEGDYSQVAFWMVAGQICDQLEIKGMSLDTKQGDSEVIEIIERMKGELNLSDEVFVSSPSATEATIIDGSQCPDIIPVLTVLAALSKGRTEVINAGRLRIKESDRLKAICTELNKMGAKIEELENGLIIDGVEGFKGAKVSSWNDHRIAMSIAVASTRTEGEIILDEPMSVRKSYPSFWEDFKSLGGQIEF